MSTLNGVTISTTFATFFDIKINPKSDSISIVISVIFFDIKINPKSDYISIVISVILMHNITYIISV